MFCVRGEIESFSLNLSARRLASMAQGGAGKHVEWRCETSMILPRVSARFRLVHFLAVLPTLLSLL